MLKAPSEYLIKPQAREASQRAHFFDPHFPNSRIQEAASPRARGAFKSRPRPQPGSFLRSDSSREESAKMPKYMPDCIDCGVPITIDNGYRQQHANKKGERPLINTCRACKIYHVGVRKRLRRQMSPPPFGTPCDCCGRASRKLELDHDHRTGEHRGWTCGPCNRGIGLLQDSLEGVLQAVAYLSRGQGLAEEICQLTNRSPK